MVTWLIVYFISMLVNLWMFKKGYDEGQIDINTRGDIALVIVMSFLPVINAILSGILIVCTVCEYIEPKWNAFWNTPIKKRKKD